MLFRMPLLGAAAIAVALTGAGCSDSETAKQQYLRSGDEYAASGRMNEAIVEYRNAIQADPLFGEARWQLAQAYEKTGNTQGAFREYVRAADLLPRDAGAQVKAGTYLLLTGRYEDAKTRADLALKQEPNSADALILRANATAGLKDVPGAIRDIEEALETEPSDGRVYTSLGALRLVEGQRVGAEAAFRKAVDISPESVEARLALAHFYWSTERPEEVEPVLQQALALNPEHLVANRMLGVFYVATGRAAEAETPFKAFAERSGEPSSALVLADYYIRTRRPDDAIAVLKPLTGTGSAAGAATLRLAQLERGQGRMSVAAQLLDGLLESEPRNVAALTLKSGWQLRDGDVPGAIQTGRAAVAADPASAPAHFALAQALVESRQPQDAIASLSEVLRINPRILSAQLMLSRLHLAAGDAPAALQLAAEARKAAPSNPDVQYTYARTLLAQGNFVQAEPEVRALLAKYPQFAASHNIAGMLLLARHDQQGARAAFGRALERDPNSIEALDGLLSLDAAAGSLQAAVGRVEGRVAKNPKSAPLTFLAARTYAAAKQPARAEAALRSLLDLDPGNLNAYLMLGRLYAAQGRLDDALTEYDAAVAKRPNHVGAATMAAMILQMQNKETEAQKRYEAIVAAHPRQAPVAANNLAWLYAEHGGDLTEALQLAQSAKAQLPDVPEVSDTLGWVYYKQNLPQLAIPPLEQSAAKDPKNAGYQMRLGLAYAGAGRNKEAAAALQRALELELPADQADLARQTLAGLKG